MNSGGIIIGTGVLILLGIIITQNCNLPQCPPCDKDDQGGGDDGNGGGDGGGDGGGGGGNGGDGGDCNIDVIKFQP